ncbi:MAG TPA: hypothetical protein VF162_05055 [Streptosporangiaceae bacterium]
MGVILVLAAGGLAIYLAPAHHDQLTANQHHGHDGRALPSRVRKAQTVGIIDIGPVDHPMKLLPTAHGVSFVAIARSEIRAGVPVWTDNHMADGTDIFIYPATGQCLSAGRDPAKVLLTHCDLGLDQRWRPVDAGTIGGQPFAEYANAQTGGCLTAPQEPGPATLAACGKPRLPGQEIAFWWNA